MGGGAKGLCTLHVAGGGPNSGFSPGRAIQIGALLAAEGISHFEEPCPYWKLAETKQVTDALAIDVTGGEQDWDLG